MWRESPAVRRHPVAGGARRFEAIQANESQRRTLRSREDLAEDRLAGADGGPRGGGAPSKRAIKVRLRISPLRFMRLVTS